MACPVSLVLRLVLMVESVESQWGGMVSVGVVVRVSGRSPWGYVPLAAVGGVPSPVAPSGAC